MLSDTEQADGMKTKEHRQTGRREKKREGGWMQNMDKGIDGYMMDRQMNASGD